MAERGSPGWRGSRRWLDERGIDVAGARDPGRGCEDVDGDQGYLYVPGEILLREEDDLIAGDILERLEGRRRPDGDRGRRVAGLGKQVDATLDKRRLRRWFVPGDRRVPEVLDTLRREAGSGRVRAAPNHVFSQEPHYAGGKDVPVPAAALPELPLDAPQLPAIAILDTGIVGDWDRHPWFAERTTTRGQVLDIPDADRDDVLDPKAGHGTFIAGIIVQRAPAARLVVDRVLDSFGLATDAEVAVALSDTDEPVVNLSLGGYTRGDEPPAATGAVLDALPADRLVVAAAGNAGLSRPFWPAAHPEVLAVGALDRAGDRASWSNYGEWVNVWAPGTELVSAFVVHDGPDERLDGLELDPDAFAGCAQWSGTSFAAPAVAAWIARHAGEHGTGVIAARDALLADEGRRVAGLGPVLDPQ